MRRKFRYDPATKEMVEVSLEHRAPPRDAPHVIGDLPDYESPVSGLIVHGRRGRRDDLKRHGCRPFESREQEEKEAVRQRRYAEEASDRKLDDAARRAFYQLHPNKRRTLEGH